MLNRADGPQGEQRNDGAWDITAGLLSWRLWAFFGLQDIRQRYRRSLLGPIWLALGLGVTIFGIGFLYSQILKTPTGTFVPFIAISLLLWNMMATIMGESTTILINGAGVISSLRVPYTTFSLRCVVRNLIVAAHGLIVVILAFLFYQYPVSVVALVAIPGFLLLVVNLYWISVCISVACLRYRDVGQIINYLIQFALFVTPIIWMPSQVRPFSPFLQFNPLYHLINIVRGPVYGGVFPADSYFIVSLMTVFGLGFTTFLFIRVRKHIIFWI